jgi:asparagine synthase (glutamine-hydrolysing)
VPQIGRIIATFGGIEQAMVGLSASVQPSLLADVFPGFRIQQSLERRMAIWSSTREASLLERMLTYEQRAFLPDLLMRQDRMSMAASIENRVPLLDHRVVEFAKRIPTDLKVSLPLLPLRGQGMLRTKRILKKITAKRFGKAFAYRTKCGFALPLPELFGSKPFADAFARYREVLRGLGFCDVAAVDRAYEVARTRGGAQADVLWTLVALASWVSIFLGGARPAPDAQLARELT